MKLESLIDFEWYNEPDNVVFADQEMKIVAKPQTDFWQAVHHKLSKDNAHFFYKTVADDFELIVKWRCQQSTDFNQCGLMVRSDERHWFKMSLMSKDERSPEIGTCLTLQGHSDWAGTALSSLPTEIFYKITRKQDDFVAFYSLDGKHFTRLRQFYIPHIDPEIKAGAYIAAPQNKPFEAVLDEIDFS
ncbi:MAG: DUF1349 domain-containing protein [Alphaproteobacteria bacterium]|nr:DUF1349 domain-containing protein [Alphaproteobacteria bacterium]